MLNLTGTVGAEELLWTFIAAIGLGYSLSNRREALEDLRAAKALVARFIGVNGRRVRVATWSARVEALLASIEIIFILVGVISMTRSPSVEATLMSRLITAGLMMAASTMLTIISIGNREVRRIVASWGEKEHLEQLEALGHTEVTEESEVSEERGASHAR